MANTHSYTPDEIAQLLKVSRLTIYDLIKKGELPAFKVGRQMRVDAEDLEAYKQKTKSGGGTQHLTKPVPNQASASQITPSNTVRINEHLGQIPVIISGQDNSLDILTRHLEKLTSKYRPLRSYIGSLNGLVAMNFGACDLVSTHLFDGETGEYNLPYIRRFLVGHSYLVIHLLSRWAGFYVQQGNPHNMQTWQDLKRPGLRIINREKGSGARVLLEEQLRLHQIDPQELSGYDLEESTHIAVAASIAQGKADLGIGIEHAARLVGVDFIPLIKESYDLVIKKTNDNSDLIEHIIQVLHSTEFKNELHSIPGYDLTDTGKTKFET